MITEHLIIRRFLPEDGDDLFAYLSLEDVVQYEPYEVFTKEEARKEALRRTEDESFWAVVLKDTGRLIGNVYLGKQDAFTSELGFVFHTDYQGKGFAYEASCAILRAFFEAENAHRVVAYCNPLNIASWKLLERLGMRRESHKLKNVYFNKDENDIPIWQDTYEYGLLKTEWEKDEV